MTLALPLGPVLHLTFTFPWPYFYPAAFPTGQEADVCSAPLPVRVRTDAAGSAGLCPLPHFWCVV